MRTRPMHGASPPRFWTQLPTLWRSEFHVYHALDADSAAIRARHMQSIGRLTPLMMVGNAIGAAMLAASLGSAVSSGPLTVWLVAVLLSCLGPLRNWWRRRNRPPLAVSPKAVTHAVRGAVSLAVLWAGATAAWLPVIHHEQQLLMSTLVVGMMCGGAFALASVPEAAIGYLVPMTLGSALGLARAGGMVYASLLVMVVVYGVLLCLSVLINARIHTARLVSEREAGRQGELVGLLLRDFEEHAADLLWECGLDGRFTRVSDRLAAALGTGREALLGSTLLEVLSRRAPAQLPQSRLAELAQAMAEGRPFRDLVVPIQAADGPRWWSITAKPLTAGTAASGGWRGVIADVTLARESHERLAQLAHFDTLTGLANRVQLRDRVRQALQDGRTVALLCLDVDHFKSINDTFGHAVGDAVLVEVARRLRSGLRQADLASRLGGDEFALVAEPADDPEQVQALAGRLVRTLCEPFEVDGHAVPMSVSVGVAWAPAHGRDLDELMGNADLALYAAKDSGRGRFECFAQRLRDRHRRRVLIAQELHGALARGEFSLAWQPQVHIATGDVVGAEVLLRWQHPSLGSISPAEFIAVAEESGQINAIGNWVLELACTGAMALPATVAVSVNASPAQLMREDFLASVALALARSRLPAQRLKVEITESLFMDAVPVALANLHGLRELGVGIALDDFGTGYSSLAYLLRFPFDTLKIDRAFVLEIMARDDARALVRAIVEMARTMGMGTVAEGVEEAAQLAVLHEAGCDAVQGYLLARPMPLADLQAWLARRRDVPAQGLSQRFVSLPQPAPVRNFLAVEGIASDRTWVA